MLHRILRLPLLTALLCAITMTQAFALSVNDVRFGAHPDKTRLVFDLSASSDFRAFTLADPYRLVVDLPTFDWRAGTVPFNAASGVTGVRHGNLEAGISRIVFDLNRPINIETAFVLPSGSGLPDRLVIDITNTDTASFSRTQGQSFGTLELNGGMLRAPSDEPRTASLSNNNSGFPTPQSKPKATVFTKKPLVIVDAGHGGVDPGAIGANGVHEKIVTLALAKELKRQLEASGRYQVKLTRETDTFVKLYDRVKFARAHGGDLFVSIHADSIGKSHIHGASVYTLSDKASDAQTAKLAARENKADLIAGIDLNTEDQEVANILVDLAMRDTMNQSKFFANTLVDELRLGGISILEKPHRYAGFAVLKAPDIPSILVEVGFMSNPDEARRLTTDVYRQKIARSLMQGINSYFNTVAENERS